MEKTEQTRERKRSSYGVCQYNFYAGEIAKVQNSLRKVKSRERGLYEDYRDALSPVRNICSTSSPTANRQQRREVGMDKKVIAIYLRLSGGDKDIGRNESNSIANQRQLILDYIQSDKVLSGYEIREFVDDGVSGARFDREQCIWKFQKAETELWKQPVA